MNLGLVVVIGVAAGAAGWLVNLWLDRRSSEHPPRHAAAGSVAAAIARRGGLAKETAFEVPISPGPIDDAIDLRDPDPAVTSRPRVPEETVEPTLRTPPARGT